MAFVAGAAVTRFGRLPGPDATAWQERAADLALADAGLERSAVNGLLVGYATTLAHLMPADLLAEQLGIHPRTAFGVSAGGATGLSMLATAARLVDTDMVDTVLVVAGEDRRSGQSTRTSAQTLAQVGHRDYEVPLGATVPAYYALLASHHLSRHGLQPSDLAPLAVQMRDHAVDHPDAHLRSPITVDDVLTSRVIASPLRLLDCCPVSDGGAALVVTREPSSERAMRVAGLDEAHRHQHLVSADLEDLGARRAANGALEGAGWSLEDIDIAAIYDSFTVTLAMLLEEIGFCAPGAAGADAAAGRFARDGDLPLNTHGGLLSYGHCGVGGGLAHAVEVVTQLRGEAGPRQCTGPPQRGLVHADGGVMSAHVSVALERR